MYKHSDDNKCTNNLMTINVQTLWWQARFDNVHLSHSLPCDRGSHQSQANTTKFIKSWSRKTQSPSSSTVARPVGWWYSAGVLATSCHSRGDSAAVARIPRASADRERQPPAGVGGPWHLLPELQSVDRFWRLSIKCGYTWWWVLARGGDREEGGYLGGTTAGWTDFGQIKEYLQGKNPGGDSSRRNEKNWKAIFHWDRSQWCGLIEN